MLLISDYAFYVAALTKSYGSVLPEMECLSTE